jgi:hypothetical protein
MVRHFSTLVIAVVGLVLQGMPAVGTAQVVTRAGSGQASDFTFKTEQGIKCIATPPGAFVPLIASEFVQAPGKLNPVLVTFNATWATNSFNGDNRAYVRLVIDDVVQPGPGSSFDLAIYQNSNYAINVAHGWTFISGRVTPGPHTATVQWATDNPSAGDVCTQDRVMVVHHNKGVRVSPDGQ